MKYLTHLLVSIITIAILVSVGCTQMVEVDLQNNKPVISDVYYYLNTSGMAVVSLRAEDPDMDITKVYYDFEGKSNFDKVQQVTRSQIYGLRFYVFIKEVDKNATIKFYAEDARGNRSNVIEKKLLSFSETDFNLVILK